MASMSTTTASTMYIDPISSRSSTFCQGLEWHFITLENDQPVLHTLPIKPGHTGATIMHLLKRAYQDTIPTRKWFQVDPHLEDAIISPLCTGDPEAQDYPRKVIVESSAHLADLTKAFHDPSIIRQPDFVCLHDKFSVGGSSASGHEPRHAILIRAGARRHSAVGYVVAALVLSVVVGVVTGVLSRDTKVGLATSATAVGVFALIQASLFGGFSFQPDRP